MAAVPRLESSCWAAEYLRAPLVGAWSVRGGACSVCKKEFIVTVRVSRLPSKGASLFAEVKATNNGVHTVSYRLIEAATRARP